MANSKCGSRKTPAFASRRTSKQDDDWKNSITLIVNPLVEQRRQSVPVPAGVLRKKPVIRKSTANTGFGRSNSSQQLGKQIAAKQFIDQQLSS